jgi:hypothetical protein
MYIFLEMIRFLGPSLLKAGMDLGLRCLNVRIFAIRYVLPIPGFDDTSGATTLISSLFE